jgi:hypothetical protein
MMHAWDSSAMKQERLRPVLERLTEIFEMPLAHYRKNTAKKGAVDEIIFGAAGLDQALVPVKAAGQAYIDDQPV